MLEVCGMKEERQPSVSQESRQRILYTFSDEMSGAVEYYQRVNSINLRDIFGWPSRR